MQKINIHDVIELAKQAGQEILHIYHSDDFSVESKEDNSPLTKADKISHKVIENGLMKIMPRFPILSEEGRNIPFAERKKWKTYWLIDPLDGTKEFIKRNGEFTVNIALIDHHRPTLGVVYAPALDTLYYATPTSGAYKMVGNAKPVQIHVSQTMQKPVRLVGSRSHGSEHVQAFAEQFGEYEFVTMGSSLKICLVADGGADIYPRFGLTSEWDIAAAQCIVECAGGYVKDFTLKKLEYNKKEELLNPYFFVAYEENAPWMDYFTRSLK